jgi:transposase
MPIRFVGLDTAKNVFQMHGVDERGRVVIRKRLRRSQLTDYLANIPACTIGLEATGGSRYWARVLETFGHTVRLIAPQFIKPYVLSQKNDPADAAAICEAVSRPHMRFVTIKTVEQQDMQLLHRIRSRLIGSRTQLANQIRGLLNEYGIVLPQLLAHVRHALPCLTEEQEPRLTGFAKELFADLYDELCALDKRIAGLDQKLDRVYRQNPLCQKISAIEGVGPVLATAVVSAVGNGRMFRNGRQFAAWLGLVPRQHSSGDKQRLSGITKRGDSYLRTLLVLGSQSVLYRAANKQDSRSKWMIDKQRKLGTAKACVAVANKKARTIWAVLAHNEPYRKAA